MRLLMHSRQVMILLHASQSDKKQCAFGNSSRKPSLTDSFFALSVDSPALKRTRLPAPDLLSAHIPPQVP